MFNLITMVNALEKIGRAFPNVNTVVLSDIYKLNDNPSIDYSVFAIVQDQHRQDDDYFYFCFYLYYVDRLKHDKSNQLEIQSHGINFLSTVINKVEQLGLIVNTEFDRTYQSFNQRFSDECAGVFARVEIQVPVDCQVPYDVLVDPLLGDISISFPGTYNPQDYGVDAFKSVTVEGELPDIWVKKVPTQVECTVGNPVDMNDLTTSGYYFINAHNIQISNFINFYGWCPDVLVHTIRETHIDSGITRNYTVQVATTTLTDGNDEGNIYWPRRWYRIKGWNSKIGDEGWSNWQEIATNENAMMKAPLTIQGTSANTVNFNNLTKSGYYFVRGNWAYTENGPLEHLIDGILEVIQKYDANGLQKYTTVDGGKTRIFVRYYSWSGWQPWTEITNDGEVQTLKPTSASTLDFNDLSGISKTYFIIAAGNEDYLTNAPIKADGMLEVISRASENDVVQRYTTTWAPYPRVFVRSYGWDDGERTSHWSGWYEFSLTPVNNQ